MKEETTKTLKLQSKYRANAASWEQNNGVPWLTMSGVWLEKLGFNIGDTVRVTAENRKIVIEVIKN